MPTSARKPGFVLGAALATILLPLLLAPESGAQGERQATIVVRTGPEAIREDFIVGKIRSVTSPTVNDDLLKSTGIVSRNQLVEVELLEGQHKGSTVLLQNEITDNPSYNIKAQPGKEVVLSVVTDKGGAPEINIADYHRAPVLLALACAFLAAFVIFGGKEGLRSLLGLGLTIALVGLVLLPMSLNGHNPLLTATLICLAGGACTIFSVAGFTRKGLAAMLGTLGGVAVAGIAAQLVIETAPLTGLSSEEAQILRGSVMSQPPQFFAGLLTASMLIGALGVIMDVAISIASAVWELSQADSRLDSAGLYARGMNVGRDIMGSMTSTLVLAYAGSALPLLLLLAHTPSMKLLNLDLVATEVASALTGSLGLVLTIPLTALAASRLMSGGPKAGKGKSNRSDPFKDMERPAPANKGASEKRLSRRNPLVYNSR